MVTVRPEETVVHELPVGWIDDFYDSHSARWRRNFETTSSAPRVDIVPRVAVVELPRARVLGSSRAVITEANALIVELSRYWGTTRASEHPLHLHPFTGPPVELEGRIGVLAGRGDDSYYHFLVEILPRVELLARCDEFAPIDRWYAPMSARWQRDLLEAFGVPAERIVDSDAVSHVRGDVLVIPTFPDDVNRQAPPWVVAYLRKRLLADDVEPIPGRRLYVSRGNQPNTRCVRNERDVLEMLKAEGFSSVDPASFPLDEEIRMFAEAEWIVAPHGASLANLLFASPAASVVELFAPGYVECSYWKLAGHVGMNYRYLLGEGHMPRSGRMTRVSSDITVNVDKLRRIVRALPPATIDRHKSRVDQNNWRGHGFSRLT